MKYRESKPSPALGGNIKVFWSLECDPAGDASEPETVLPDGCPEIVFNLSDRFERLHANGSEIQPATLFAGQMRRSIAIRPTGHVRLFGVRFHPAGAFAVGGPPMHELTDHIPGIGSVLGPGGSELESRVWDADGFKNRIAVFEKFLMARLAAQPREDLLPAHAAALIARSGGAIPISRLCERLGVSERRLERRSRAQVGLSPKTLARIVRFQSVVRKLQYAETPKVLDAVHEFGYFDQSHLIRDFREFSGDTPLGYFEKTHSISDIFTAS